MLRVLERHNSNSRSFTSIEELFYSIDGILSNQIRDTGVLHLQDAVSNTQKLSTLEGASLTATRESTHIHFTFGV